MPDDFHESVDLGGFEKSDGSAILSYDEDTDTVTLAAGLAVTGGSSFAHLTELSNKLVTDLNFQVGGDTGEIDLAKDGGATFYFDDNVYTLNNVVFSIENYNGGPDAILFRVAANGEAHVYGDLVVDGDVPSPFTHVFEGDAGGSIGTDVQFTAGTFDVGRTLDPTEPYAQHGSSGFSVNEGTLAGGAGSALIVGALSMTKPGSEIQSASPDGTMYKLVAPNGGGAAAWVAV